jgi:hypothetical protein
MIAACQRLQEDSGLATCGIRDIARAKLNLQAQPSAMPTQFDFIFLRAAPIAEQEHRCAAECA